ncbi:hypothetical protein STREPTOSP366_15900, partial [Streptomyces variabilis]
RPTGRPPCPRGCRRPSRGRPSCATSSPTSWSGSGAGGTRWSSSG